MAITNHERVGKALELLKTGLGPFVELEVILRPGQDISEGVAIAHDLIGKLGISQYQFVERAYVDLLLDQ